MGFWASHQLTQVSRKMNQNFPDFGQSISSLAVFKMPSKLVWAILSRMVLQAKNF